MKLNSFYYNRLCDIIDMQNIFTQGMTNNWENKILQNPKLI